MHRALRELSVYRPGWLKSDVGVGDPVLTAFAHWFGVVRSQTPFASEANISLQSGLGRACPTSYE